MDILNTKDISQINDELNSSYKASFGENTDTSQHSVLGNVKAPVAIVIGFVHELLDYIMTQINPRTAKGTYLDIICSLNNIYRIANSKSQAIITFVSDSDDDIIIPKGTKVSTNDKVEFLTKNDALLLAKDSIKIAIESVEYGILSVSANSITNLDDTIPGILSVTNELRSESGELRETDAQLRKRREDSISVNSNSTVESIKANLLALDGVKSVFVYESGDGKTIPIDDLPDSYIYAVIDGGANSELAKVLAKTKTVGIPTVGNTSDTYTDLNGKVVTYYFDRPSKIKIEVDIEIIITNTNLYPLNGTSMMKQNLYDYLVLLNIGDDIYQNLAMSALNTIPGCVVSTFKIKKGDEDFTSDAISMSVNELGTYSIEDISVRII